jgi:glycosyltransferase involved in cell wall biosynthesis
MKIALLTTDSRECFRDYAAPRAYYGTAPAALLEGLAELPDVEVHVVSCTQEHLTPEDQLAPNIRAHSLFVPKIGWLRTGYQGCIRAVRNKLKQIRPDIVHGQGTERDCAISAVFSGYPNVLTIHGNMRAIAKVNRASLFSYQWFAARLEQFTLPRSGGIVCITDYTRKAVQELTDRTWIVPNAVSQDFFEISRAPQSPPLMLCVGSIAPHKNQNVLIRSLDELARQRSFSLVFLGQLGDSNEYNAEFQLLVEQRSWCSHKGFADRTNLKAYLQSASLLVLPSLEDNCPMVVLEAMASGVPVVAARVGGVPELIEDGQTGLLCDPSNSRSILEAVSRILDSATLAANVAANAQVSAQKRFHPHVIARRHVEIYEEILAGRSTDS